MSIGQLKVTDCTIVVSAAAELQAERGHSTCVVIVVITCVLTRAFDCIILCSYCSVHNQIHSLLQSLVVTYHCINVTYRCPGQYNGLPGMKG